MIVLIAGPIAVGKTSTAEALVGASHGQLIRVRQALADVLGVPPDDRLALQRLGAELDARTGGRWLLDYVEEHATHEMLVVDSMRTRRQTLPMLEHLVDSTLIYLDAHESTRRARYAAGSVLDPLKSSVPYDTAVRHRTELRVPELLPLAHAVVSTDDLDVTAVLKELKHHLTPAG